MTKKFEELVLEQFNILHGQFSLMNERFNHLELRIDQVDQKIDRVEANIIQRIEKIEHRMDKLEIRMDKLEVRMNKLEIRMDVLEVSYKDVEKELNKHVERAMGHVLSELFKTTEMFKHLQDIYDMHGDRITKTEDDIKLVSTYVGYSTYHDTSTSAFDRDLAALREKKKLRLPIKD